MDAGKSSVKQAKVIWDEANAAPFNKLRELIGEIIPKENFVKDGEKASQSHHFWYITPFSLQNSHTIV